MTDQLRGRLTSLTSSPNGGGFSVVVPIIALSAPLCFGCVSIWTPIKLPMLSGGTRDSDFSLR